MKIDRLIENNEIFHYYQPIYDIHQWEVIGYEALLRTNIYNNPEIVFEIAKEEKNLYTLDTHSILKAIDHYIRSEEYVSNNYLFVNVYPSTLINPNFLDFIDSINILPLNLILEVNEKELIQDINEFVLIIDYLKKRNVHVAIDDVGKGSSEIVKILEFHPKFIKIDSYVTQGITNTIEKELLLKLLIDYCSELQINLILEGIEDIEVLYSAKNKGAIYGQGFLLGKPKKLNTIV